MKPDAPQGQVVAEADEQVSPAANFQAKVQVPSAARAEPVPPFPVTGTVLDGEATSAWERAAWIGLLSTDDALRSYTTLLAALLHEEGDLGRWLLRYARAVGIEVARIDAARDVTPARLREIARHRESGEAASGKTQWTPSVKQLAEKAAGLASEAHASQLGARHLFGAYLYEIPSVHRAQLAGWGIEPQRESSALLRQVKARNPQELDAWLRRHSSAFGEPPDLQGRDPLPRPRISGFAADTPEGSDLLDIEDDVYALCALISSTRIQPPLSIGLFGDWGSGKSFFIRQLQAGVAWITAEARASKQRQQDIPFYKHVVQIEFNAWNYSGGNLWAALVQHILDNLRLSPKDGDDLVEQRRAVLQKEMDLQGQVQRAAQASANKADQELRRANQALDDKRTAHEDSVQALKAAVASDVLATVKLDEATVKELNELRSQLGLPAVEMGAAELLAALEGTRAVLGRATAVLGFVPPAQRARFLLASAGVVLGPLAAALVVGAIAQWIAPSAAGIASVASWLSAALAAGSGWLRQRTRVLSDHLAQVERLQALARQRVEAEEQRHRGEVAQLEKRIALAHDELVAAQAKQQQAVVQLERIQGLLSGTTPASVLADFVRERSESSDYRRYLGLPAVIRRDFERISKMIAAENAEVAGMATLEKENEQAKLRMNRIVLYIDDLDRCSEELVVDVLRAVHLLLAFPLFVVVVAVDARWVSRSLAKRFPGLLTPAAEDGPRAADPASEGNASPMDYLEKIFQIPFWLRQPSETAVKNMLASLMREGESVGTEGPRESTSGEGSIDGGGPDREPGTEGAGKPAGDGKPAADGPGQLESLRASAAVFRHREHDPHAKALDIQSEESDHIVRLAPLLDRTPRSLKRFVNVYRVMKASLPREELDAFLVDDGPLGAPYRSVLLLLAVESGLPALSSALLSTLLETPAPEGQARSLGQALDRLAAGRQELKADLARLVGWLDSESPGWRAADPTRFLEWVPRVARYSYQLHRSGVR